MYKENRDINVAYIEINTPSYIIPGIIIGFTWAWHGALYVLMFFCTIF